MSALPSLRDAQLPGAYVQAKDALAKCEKIDECKSWADRAAALASYARQAEDDSLRTLSTRIQARAIRRCGELLKAMAPSDEPGRRPTKGGGAPPITRRGAAKSAGLSRDQQRTALRVASIPKDDFEREVESDDPPTVTSLAEMGKLPKWAEKLNEAGKKPGFAKATRLQGLLREFARFCHDSDPSEVADAVIDNEVRAIKENMRAVEKWLSRFAVKL